MAVRETKLAWAAGFFDGEGCIKVNRQAVTHGLGYRHVLVLHVGQKIKMPLEILQSLFGGKIYKCLDTRHNEYRYEWVVCNYEAVKVLKLLNKFLTLKKEECMLALKYSKYFISKKTFKVTKSEFKKREDLYFKLRSLKDKNYNRIK